MTAAVPSLRESPAVRQSLSVGVAVGLYGISFGAIAVTAGLTVPQAVVLSAVLFSGGSQFAFVGALADGGLAATASAWLVGLRNGLYGAQANAWFGPQGWKRLLSAHLTIDESIAVAVAQEDRRERRRGFWGAGIAVFVLWNAFTVVGALLGNLLGDPKVWGLDGAAIAAFCGLLWPRLTSRDAVAVAVLGAVVTLVAVPVVPPGLPILLAVTICGGVVWWRRRSRA